MVKWLNILMVFKCHKIYWIAPLGQCVWLLSQLLIQLKFILAWIGVNVPSERCNGLIHLFLTFYFLLHVCEWVDTFFFCPWGLIVRNVKTNKQQGGLPLGMLTLSLSLFHTYTLSSTYTVNSVFLPQGTSQSQFCFVCPCGVLHAYRRD